MNELISQIADHAQISEDSAKRALDSVIAYLRDKVPGPVFAQIEGYLGGEVSGESLVTGAKSAFGSFSKE